MRLLTIDREGSYTLGVETEAGIVDVAEALVQYPAEQPLPLTVDAVIAGGEQALLSLREYIEHLSHVGYALSKASDIQWGPCVTQPQKIICIGLNYRKHAEETNAPIPTVPIVFSKFNNALTGHLQDVLVPQETEKLDYEAELAIVIGKRANHVTQDEALDYVFGYASANDLSARDLQVRTPQWLLGKTCDGFCPLGPYLVTADEIPDPNRLDIKCTVNGEIRQHSNTSDMIFNCREIISYLSNHMTLYPGDVILTGTPEGVVLGYPPEKQVYLQPGDVVTIEIEQLGALTNRMA